MRRLARLPVLRRLLELPIRRKLYCVALLLTANLAAVIAIGVFGMWILSSLRAYVGGEGLWAKSQKNAVYALSSYALSRDEKDYRAYLAEMRVPLGDRKARLELEKANPDLRACDAGFIEGGNHPDDVRGMATLFRRFGRFGYIRRAIALWGRADEALAELQAEAEDLHRRAADGRLSGAQARARLERIAAINARLTAIENDFSYTLGDASRWAKRALFFCMTAGAVLFGGLGLLVALLVGQRVADGISALSEAATRAAGGDLSGRVEAVSADEIGRLAEAFNRMTEGLSKLDRMKNDFISTASHELRTPLTLTLAPLETLLAGEAGPLGAEQLELLRVMHNNALRQLQLVNGLLDFSKLEAGRVEVRRESVDAAALTRGVADDFRPLARGKGLTLEVRADAGSPPVALDRYLYERILFNLLSNAVKFTPRGGSVRVGLSQGGGRLTLTVADTGVGIPPEQREHLFQRFRQLDSSSTRRFEGTGLGLALVREFAALLGGTVALRGGPGLGSEFEVVIDAPPASGPAADVRRTPARVPLWDDADAERAPAAEPGDEGGVLIAEDNAELRAYLARLLRELGPVRSARNGEEALALAAVRAPELVLADVMMPGLDGLGLCRRLKADARTAGVPVVLLTALTDRESLTRGWKAGADEYLFKPFHPKEVLTRVRTLLASARARRRAEDALLLKNRDLELAAAETAAANEELKSFTYTVAHDLRAPLRNLDAFCVYLEKELGAERLTPDARELMRRIHGSVERMDAILLGLLELSRVGRQEFAPAPVDLGAIAASVVEELRRREPERAVEVELAPDLRAEGDPGLLRIALRHLLGNAWKFTSRRTSARVEVGGARMRGETVFFVRDDGAGFDLPQPQRLFGPFQRFHSAREFPGTGLGLAVVKRIVERHGGRVWAESALGRGAAFYFTLGASAAVSR